MRGNIRVYLKGQLSRGTWEKLSAICEIRDVKLKEDGAEMTIRAEKLKELRKSLSGQGMTVRILKRYGILGLRKGSRLHPALLFSLLAACLLLWGVTRTVLYVDIEGAKDGMQETQLRMKLSEMGIEKGVWRDSVDVTAASEEILRTTKGITYAGLKRTGAGLTLTVVQATEKPAVFDENIPMDVVAVCGGIVKKVVCYTGEALVDAGDTVIPGQVLIRGNERCPHGSGEVWADVWVQGTGQAELNETEPVFSGRECVTKRLCLGKNILFEKGKSEFSDEVIKETRACICPNLFLPISVEKVVHREKKDAAKARKLSVVRAESAAKALENALKILPAGAIVVDKRTEYSMIEKGKLACVLTLHGSALIGQERPK